MTEPVGQSPEKLAEALHATGPDCMDVPWRDCGAVSHLLQAEQTLAFLLATVRPPGDNMGMEQDLMNAEQLAKQVERVRQIAAEWQSIAESDEQFRMHLVENSKAKEANDWYHKCHNSRVRAECWANALLFFTGEILVK